MSKQASRFSTKHRYGIYLGAILILVLGALFYTVLINRGNSQQPGGLTLDNSNNNAYAAISSDDISTILGEGDFIWNGDNSYYGYEKDPVVALVHIDSIQGGRNYSPISDQYVYPQTYGKMTFKEVFKGDVKVGDQVTYSRLGGIVTFDEYWAALNKEQKDKILYLNNGQKPKEEKYVKEKFKDDIDIQVNKDYVVFLIPQTWKDGTQKEYFIDGMQYGLREVRGSGTNKEVLNNITGQWEKINKIVKQ